MYRKGLHRQFQCTIDRSKFSTLKAAIELFRSLDPLGMWEIGVLTVHFFVPKWVVFGVLAWGERWGFKQIRGYVRKKAFFLRFLDFPGAARALRKRAKRAAKGRKRPISADFQDGRPDTP